MTQQIKQARDALPKMVKQTVTGEMGNCMSACLASVFGLKIQDVPNFHETAKTADDWWKQVRDWLSKKGFGLISINYDISLFERLGPSLLIVSGMSQRGMRHATVWHKGKMINDPHPDNTGIEPDTIDIIFPLIPAALLDKEIERGANIVSREMRLTIEGMAKQRLSSEIDSLDLGYADLQGGYDEMIKHARKLKAMIATQEEK